VIGCSMTSLTVVDFLFVQVVQRRGHLDCTRQHTRHVRQPLGSALRRWKPQLVAVNGSLQGATSPFNTASQFGA
jgi:hypothetical protein